MIIITIYLRILIVVIKINFKHMSHISYVLKFYTEIDRHDITEILLKVALNTINQTYNEIDHTL